MLDAAGQVCAKLAPAGSNRECKTLTPELHQKLTAWRRHLHAHPEVSLQERATSTFVQEKLTELGIAFEAGIGGHGVVATLSRGSAGGRVGLRADMDALPITEDTGLPYASKNPGVMHACGHDGHTASLLGAAALLATDTSWSGTVDFIFQPAEEGFGGSRAMVGAGLFERFPMSRVFGFHNWPGLEAGTIAVHDGVVMASGGRVSITIEGHAGHAGLPHLTRDPVVAAGHLIVAMQSIVSRSVDPLDTAVLSLCTIEGGTARNQVAGRVTIGGTLRHHREGVRDTIVRRIEQICAGIATSFGVKVTPEITLGVGAVINAPEEANLARIAAAKMQASLRSDLAPSMAAEDFAFYLTQRPGAFVWIGNGDLRAGAELHGPRYDFNDAILPVAARWMAEVAKTALAAN
jgi:hippurate hydrolase